MTSATLDKQEQYDKVAAGLLPGEQIVAVYDAIGAGTRFIAMTTRRVVLQDNSFMGKKTAVTSLPYVRVTAVSFVSDASMFGRFASTSAIAVTAGGRVYEVQLRGEDKARALHDGILSRVLSATS